MNHYLNRNHITDLNLQKLSEKINSIIKDYKKTHGFFSFAGDRIKKLDHLTTTIQDILKSKETFFKKYVLILKSLNECLPLLHQEKDQDTIKKFKIILCSQLNKTEEASWHLTHQKDNNQVISQQQKINDCLKNLSYAATFKSTAEQKFYDTWRVLGTENQFPLWQLLINNLQHHLINNIGVFNSGAFVGDLIYKVGLEERNDILHIDQNKVAHLAGFKAIIQQIEKILYRKAITYRSILNEIETYRRTKCTWDLNRVIKLSKNVKENDLQPLLEKLTAIESQISIMTLNNLLLVATDYMQKYANQICHEEEKSLFTRSDEVQIFLKQVIKEVINPLREAFGKQVFKEEEIKTILLKPFIEEVVIMARNQENKKQHINITVNSKNCPEATALLTLENKPQQASFITSAQSRTKIFFTSFFFHQSSRSHDVDRHQATHQTHYALFKADIMQWLFKQKGVMIANEHYPSINKFAKIKNDYLALKEKASFSQLEDFFKKHFAKLLIQTIDINLNNRLSKP